MGLQVPPSPSNTVSWTFFSFANSCRCFGFCCVVLFCRGNSDQLGFSQIKWHTISSCPPQPSPTFPAVITRHFGGGRPPPPSAAGFIISQSELWATAPRPLLVSTLFHTLASEITRAKDTRECWPVSAKKRKRRKKKKKRGLNRDGASCLRTSKSMRPRAAAAVPWLRAEPLEATCLHGLT